MATRLTTLDPAFGRADEVPPDEQNDQNSDSRKVATNERAVLRRFYRASNSIGKRNGQDFRYWPLSEQKQYVETLQSAAESVKWIMENGTPVKAKTDEECSAPTKRCREDSMRPPPTRSTSSASSAGRIMPSMSKARTNGHDPQATIYGNDPCHGAGMATSKVTTHSHDPQGTSHGHDPR